MTLGATRGRGVAISSNEGTLTRRGESISLPEIFHIPSTGRHWVPVDALCQIRPIERIEMTDQTTNRHRAARIVRAQLDDDTDTARAVLDEAFADGRENGLAGIISALTTSTIELLLAATGGDLDAARKTVDLTILDQSLGGGVGGA